MNVRFASSALALVFAAVGLSSAADAQSNAVAAIPRAATTTRSHAGSCDRACLEGWVDRYFAAVTADDPRAVPLAQNVRFTENGQVLPVGAKAEEEELAQVPEPVAEAAPEEPQETESGEDQDQASS